MRSPVDVRRLAQRMLWHPQDAEDATQEILVKVATRLSTFRGDARVTTWVHRIAVNHLLTMRRGRAEDPALSFAAFGDDLARDLDAAYDPRGVDDELLAQEVMVGCTQGMLLCLDREHRVAYVLGEVLQLPSDEAAAICEITPPAFRKRLQRARERLQRFMEGHCGVLDPSNPCRCRRRIGAAIGRGRVDPEELLFVERVTPSSSRCSASPMPARSSAVTRSCAHRPSWWTPCCAPSPDARLRPLRGKARVRLGWHGRRRCSS